MKSIHSTFAIAFVGIACTFAAVATSYAMSDSYSLIGELRGQETAMLDNMTAGQCIATLRAIRPHWGDDVNLFCSMQPNGRV